MKALFAASIFLVSGIAGAATPSNVLKAATQLKANDIRTITVKTNGDGNPCDLGYEVQLQVKQASFNRLTSKTSYAWETVKTVGVDKDGNVMEVCAE